MYVPDITFVVFTFNEAARLPNVLCNFQGYGPILIVDNYSTDATVAIAREAGCSVLMNKNQGWVEDYETTENVKAAVSTEWIYWGFADEIAPKEVLSNLAQVIKERRHDIIMIQRKNYLYGQFCHDVAVSNHIKAFKKEAIDFQGNTIHNFGRVLVKEERIYKMTSDKFVHHLISNTAESYLNTINRYTDMEIVTKSATEIDQPIVYYLLLPLKVLWWEFFRGGGRISGKPALALSVFMLIYSLIKAIKAYEVLEELDSTNITVANERIVRSLLEKFP